MKKNINYITLSPKWIQWILRKLDSECVNIDESKEFIQGLRELLNTQDATLILEKAYNKELEQEYQSGDLIINSKSRKVICRGEEISLTPKEFDILYFLFQNKGEVFTKEQIYNAVWEEEYLMADSNIMAFIRKLRKKIEPYPDEPIYILTIWGVGYKYNERL
ncbi:MAG: winged helix-turn-helix domain-containing protein [Turicibacter sp.]|nr:winged helix-turn-helix domain-containing protein [Turicibacter sp.]